MSNLTDLLNLASSNLGFIIISAVVIATILVSAYGAELWIAKKHKISFVKEHYKIKRMVIIAMLSGIAVVLMLFEFPLGFIPGFYKLDFSEIPVIIGAFTLGPVAGLTIELTKIMLNLMIDGTTSAFVGEFANFLIGSAFLIPAAFVYFLRKSRRNAIAGLGIGTISATVAGGILNAFVLLPKYAQLMGPGMGMNFGQSMDFLIGEGTKANSAIHGLSTFVLLGVTPFNLIKYGIVSIVTILIYKKISHILKGDCR